MSNASKKALPTTAAPVASKAVEPAIVVATPRVWTAKTPMAAGELLSFKDVQFLGFEHPSPIGNADVAWLNTAGVRGSPKSCQIAPGRGGTGACAVWNFEQAAPRRRKLTILLGGAITIGLKAEELAALKAAGPVLRDLLAMCAPHGEGRNGAKLTCTGPRGDAESVGQ